MTEAENKDAAVVRLVNWQFDVGADLCEVYRFFAENENAPGEPIKLLAVSADTTDTGQVEIFGFGPAGDIPYGLLIATVSPDEMRQIREGSITLPGTWELSKAQQILREHSRKTCRRTPRVKSEIS